MARQAPESPLCGVDRSEGHFLLFPAGQFKDTAVSEILHSQFRCHLPQAALHPLRRHPAVFQAEDNLTIDVRIEKLCPGILKHRPHMVGKLGNSRFLYIQSSRRLRCR